VTRALGHLFAFVLVVQDRTRFRPVLSLSKAAQSSPPAITKRDPRYKHPQPSYSPSTTMSDADLSPAAWPPAFTPAQLSSLTTLASSYALAHGLLYLPPGAPPPHPSSAIHAPLALVPAPVPRVLFARAQRLQRAYNVLYARVALDAPFLDRVMGADAGAGAVDAFTGALWRGWRAARDAGVHRQRHLGLFRSDYLLDAGAALKQVEFNTISASFGALAARAARMQRYLARATGGYFGAHPLLDAARIPENGAPEGLAHGLAAAHAAYGDARAAVLFVVQEGERNVFDQRVLEYELLERCVLPPSPIRDRG
jgi:hypothetical protein